MQETSRKPPRRRRLLRWTLVAAAFTLVVLGVLVLGHRFTLDPLLARALEAVLERSLGGEATVGRMRGSYLGSVEITGLSFSAPQAQDLRRLEVARLRAEYSLWDALRRRPWLHRVEADGLDVEVVASDEPSAWPALPEDLPEVILLDSSFRVSGSGYTVVLREVGGSVARASTTGPAPGYRVEVEVGFARVEAGEQARAGSIAASFLYAGAEISGGRVELDGQERLRDVHANLGELENGVAAADGTLVLPGGAVDFDTTLTADDSLTTLKATGVDVAAALAAAGLETSDLRGSLDLDATVAVPWNEPRNAQVTVSLAVEGPRWKDWEAQRIAAAARYADSVLDVAQLTASLPQASLDAGPLTVAVPRDLAEWREARIEGAARLDVEDLGALPLPVELSGAVRAIVKGDGTLAMPEIHVELASDAFAVEGAPAAPLRMTVHAGPPAHGDVPVSAASVVLGDSRLDLRGVLLRLPSGGGSWTGAVARVQLSGSLSLVPFGIPDGVVTLQASAAGDPEALAIRLQELEITAGETFTLAEPSRIEVRATQGFVVEPLRLEASTGAVTLAANREDGGALDARVTASGLTLEPWRRWLPGGLECERIEELSARALGTLDSIEGEVSGDFRGVKIAGSPSLDVQVRLSGDGDLLQLETLRVAADGALLEASGSGPFPWPRDSGFEQLPLELQATVELEEAKALFPELGDWARTGPVYGTLAASGSWSALEWNSVWDVDDLEPVRSDLSGGAGALHAAFSGTPEGLFVDTVTLTLPHGTVNASARLEESLPGLLGQGLDAALDQPLEARADLEVDDLSWLAGPAGLRRVAGSLSADVTVTGTLRERSLSGRIFLWDGECRLAAVNAAPWSSLDAELLLEGTTLHIGFLTGELGYSPFQVTGSATGIDSSDPELDLALAGDELLLFRSRGIKVRADTALTVQGPLSQLAVGGMLEVTDSRFTRNFDLFGFAHRTPADPGGGGISLFSLTQEPWKSMTFDVEILAEEPFEVSNNVIDGGLRPQLALRGTGELPYLVGTIYVDASTLSLPASTLKVTSGTIQFESANPFEPTLNVFSTTRMLGYDVSAYLSGSLSDPVVQLSSNPPLSQEDILLLVMTGQPPAQDIDSATGRRTLTNVATYLGKDFARRFFGSESTAGAQSFLDRIELEAGKEISAQGTESIEARLRLVDEVMGPENPLYLEGERSVYDEFNLGLKLVFRFD